jgi:hypothetical protein
MKKLEYKKELTQSPIDSSELETLIEEIDDSLEDKESKKTPWGRRVLSSSHMLVDSDEEEDGVKIVQFISPLNGAITTNIGQADNDPNVPDGGRVPSIPMFVEVTKSGSGSKKLIGSLRKEKNRKRGRYSSATRRGINP